MVDFGCEDPDSLRDCDPEILLLLNTVGDYIAVQVPPAAEALHHILQEIWRGLHGIVQPGYRN
jgi:hypothetical protein